MSLLDVFNLGKAFKRYFEIVPALSPDLKDEVFRIRHQVYCEELAFEPVRPDRREHDEHDPHALHLLIRSVKTQEFIGCTRIVRVRPWDPYYPLPFESACAAALDRSIIDPAQLPRNTIGEISRLAVIGKFRNRKGETNTPIHISDDVYGTLRQPRFPHIPVGLYLGTMELALLHGIDTIFFLTEERLATHFAKLGAKVDRIGAAVEHHGLRVPSVMHPKDVIHDLRLIFRSIYRVVAADVARYIKPTDGVNPKSPAYLKM